MIDIYGDGFTEKQIRDALSNGVLSGFTTNPTLLRNLGVSNYESGCRKLVDAAFPLPISIEVLSEETREIIRQASEISKWGSNVNVKIPVISSTGQSLVAAIEEVAKRGIAVNVTAVFTTEQVDSVVHLLNQSPGSFLSIFAGRIADTGRNPVPYVADAISKVDGNNCRVIWASPREVLNVKQAEDAECHVITCSFDLVQKMSNFGKDLEEFSKETAAMFVNDSMQAGFSL